MSTKRISPTATLLRSSRLFAVPQPLPSPVEPSATPIYRSETATQHHPRHAAIATPASSLHRGDWGLKRRLPERATHKSTTPVVRINQMDTTEMITDFSSAGDHVFTLKKWQEMNIPITVPEAKRPNALGGFSSGGLAKSVFENEFDVVSTDAENGEKSGFRWKFEGPFLAGKTEGQFQQYVKKQIRGRRSEFRQYLRKELRTRKIAEMKRSALEKGESEEVGDVEITDKELHDYIITLRSDENLLSSVIHDFLDLPTPPSRSILSEDFWSSGQLAGRSSLLSSPYGETGPPKTHPSAGLSYLRTASQITSHPILGPQANPPPVKARILQPRKGAIGQQNVAKLGVGGVVANDNVQASFISADNNVPGLVNYDPFINGGPKMYVRPTRASIDSQGRIGLSIERVDPTTVQIHEGKLEERKPRLDIPTPERRLPQLSTRPSSRSPNQGYGLKGLSPSLSNSSSADDELRSSYKSIEDLLSHSGR